MSSMGSKVPGCVNSSGAERVADGKPSQAVDDSVANIHTVLSLRHDRLRTDQHLKDAAFDFESVCAGSSITP